MLGFALSAYYVAMAAPATPGVTVSIDAKGGYGLEVDGSTWWVGKRFCVKCVAHD